MSTPGCQLLQMATRLLRHNCICDTASDVPFGAARRAGDVGVMSAHYGRSRPGCPRRGFSRQFGDGAERRAEICSAACAIHPSPPGHRGHPTEVLATAHRCHDGEPPDQTETSHRLAIVGPASARRRARSCQAPAANLLWGLTHLRLTEVGEVRGRYAFAKGNRPFPLVDHGREARP